MGQTEPAYAYDAFISYSHAVDGQLLPALQRGLHRLARPWNRPRALRVFYDQTSLSVTEDLWGTIEEALRDSSHFILMASAESAASEWVGREVAHWRREREPGTFLIALTGGEIHWDHDAGDFDWDRTTALPQILRGWFSAEPLWTDLRWAHSGAQLSLQNPRFRSVVGSLAAPLHDIAKDELDSEDIRQRKSTIRLLITGVIVLVLALVAAVITGYQAEQQREKAVTQRQDAQRQRAHAEREQKVAEEQRRLASVRALLAEAETARDRDPQKALRLDLAANTLRPDAETRGALVTALTGTRYGGTSNIGNISATDAAALSPDGSLLAATDDGTGVLYLWDVRRPGQDSPLSSLGARDDVEGVAFSSDGNLLAVAARDAGVELWDVSTPRTPHKLSSPHAGQVTGAAFAPDGRTLITVGGEGDNKGKLTVWDIRRPAKPRELASLTHVEDASTVVLSPDGRTLITTSGWMRSDEEPVDKDSITHRTGLTVWDVRQPQRPVKLDRIDGWDAGPVFSPDSRTFAVGQYNRVTLWRNDLGQAPRYVSSLTGEPSTPQSLAFGKDEKTLASGYEDGAVVTWDITEPAHPRRTARLLGHTDWVETVGFLERSHQLISLDLDGAVIRWRLTPPQPSRLASLPTAGYVSRATALSPDGRTVAMGGVDENITLWDITHRRRPVRLATLKGHSKSVTTLDFSPDSTMLASGGDDRRIFLWNIADRRHPHHTAMLTRATPVGSLAFAPRGRMLAATGNKWLASDWSDGWTRFWDVGGAKPVERGRLNGGSLMAPISYSPGGNAVILSGTSSTSIVGASRTYEVHGGDGVLNRDGTAMVTSASGTSADENVVLWDVRSPAQPRKLASLSVDADSLDQYVLAFHPKSKVVAVGIHGATQLWDIGEPRHANRPHTLSSGKGEVNSMDFARDGHTLVIGSNDGAEIWDLGMLPSAAANPVAMACELAGGGLTREQWQQYVPGIDYQRVCPRT